MADSSYDSLQATLEQTQEWPSDYLFKFVVPAEQEPKARALVDGLYTTRPSRSGRYVSLTVKAPMASAAKVVEVYQKAKFIPGMICL